MGETWETLEDKADQMRLVSADLIGKVGDAAASLHERSKDLALASNKAISDVDSVGDVMVKQSLDAATAADKAAKRLSSIAEELMNNFSRIDNTSSDTEHRLHQMGANFRQRAEEFAQVAGESNAHVQALADELQVRSQQMTGVTTKVDEAGGTLQECSREVTLAVEHAAKLLSEVTSGLQDHTQQLNTVSDQALDRSQVLNELLVEGAGKFENITEKNTHLPVSYTHLTLPTKA